MLTLPKQSESVQRYAEEILERHAKMVSERSTLETHWQECLDYIIPRKGNITTTATPGSKRGAQLFDTTAINANQILASALHSMLTNPSVRFFEMMMNDPELNDDEEVRKYLQICGDKIFVVMNNSNFQTEIHENYIDLGPIGTTCLYTGEDDERTVHFAARSMKEIYIDENNLGLIDTVHREFSWKPRQIVQEFGEKNLPQGIIDEYKKGCNDLWPIVHAVSPKQDGADGYFDFKSCYILKDHKYVLSEGGYKEFPYAVPRWTKTTGEKYGRGPGMDMLADVKMVNAMMKTVIEGAQLTVRPPMLASDDGVIGAVNLTEGGITMVRAGSEDALKPLNTNARIDYGQNMVEDVRKRIRSGFFNDILQLNEGPQMTAAEVYQRTEEKLRLMGPVLGRQHFEFLRPVIERVFGIMNRKGLLPKAPQKIQGKAFDIRYSSLVARAQRMSEGQNITRAIQTSAPILQTMPESLDLVDGDKAIRYIFDIYGVPEKIMRNGREIKDRRNQRAQMQKEQSDQANAQSQAEMASKVMPGVAQLQQAQKQ